MRATKPGEVIYQLPRLLATQKKFWELCAKGAPGDPDAICVLGYFGGWGSGKTTVGKWVVFDHMVCYRGIKVLVVRDSFASLNLTTKQELLNRMTEGDPEGRNMTALFKDSWNEQRQTFTMKNGSQVTFGGLDKVEKWGSTEFGLIYVDEASLIGEQDIPFLLSRLRQAAPKCSKCFGLRCAYCGNTGNAWGSGYRRKIILTSNHVYTEHHLYKAMVGTPEAPPKVNHFYVETSSYENAPENGGYLPPGYLESLAQSGDERMVSVYMGGQWGVVPKGTPVYQWLPRLPSGQPWHERECRYDPSRPLLMAIDFGYRFPFVTLHQIQERGRWRILEEFTMPNSRTEELLFGVKGRLADRYHGCRVAICYGDPAGLANRSEGASDADTIQSVMGCPFRSLPSTDTSKVGRRSSIQRRLSMQSGAEPLVALDPRYCQRLSEALRGMYRYAELKQRFAKTNFKEEPIEEHPFVDVMHSVEYFALNHFNDQSTEAFSRMAGKAQIPSYQFRR